VDLEAILLKPVSASMLFDAIMQAFGEAAPAISRVAQRQELESETLQHIKGAQLLLVEDNEINQQVAREILEGAGLNVTLVNNGREAVQAVKTGSYDAVLMDIQMPVMDGYTATKTIRKHETERKAQSAKRKEGNYEELSAISYQPSARAQRIPIIAMTAHAMAGDEEKSLQAGMDGHVTKPIDPDQLFATLRKWIQPADKRDSGRQPQVVAPPPEADQAMAEGHTLPESLPGFDLPSGLLRLRGNKGLYRKLLLDFASDYSGAADDIRQALAAGDFVQTHSLVHNLKGLAGNLAASALQAAAINLEKLVKGVQNQAPPADELNLKMAALEDALKQALASVNGLGPSPEENICVLTDDEIAAIPAEFARDIAKQIREAADLGDVMTLNAVAETIKSRSASCEPLSTRIIQMAEEFDLEGIQQLADLLDGS
jgi:CheY-like chemotaxis protein